MMGVEREGWNLGEEAVEDSKAEETEWECKWKEGGVWW